MINEPFPDSMNNLMNPSNFNSLYSMLTDIRSELFKLRGDVIEIKEVINKRETGEKNTAVYYMGEDIRNKSKKELIEIFKSLAIRGSNGLS